MSNDTTRKFARYASQRSIPNEVKAAISKLGADPQGAGRPRQNMRLPDGRVLAHVANNTIGNIRDARNMFQILPDMDYARQILISATISPGDLTDCKVLYSAQDDTLDSALTGPLLRNAQEFFDNSYRIRSLLHPMLNDIMFETGSYPLLVLPESSIDRIINAENYSGVSMESAVSALDSYMNEETDGKGNYKPWGILGNANQSGNNATPVDSYTGVSFESLKHDNYDASVSLGSIKVSFESFVADVEENKELRVKLADLSKSAKTSLESKGSTISVTDNLSILKRPMVVETRRHLAVRRIYGGKLHGRASLESRANNGNAEAKRHLAAIEKSMYTKRRYSHVPVQPVMTANQAGGETYGHPLVIHLPSESVIPIHVPGNPAEHVGYYVLLDIDGNPISIADRMSYMDDIRAQMNNVDSQASQLIQQARRGFEGLGDINDEIITEMGRIYSEAFEADLLSRLSAGALSGNYELGKTENINRLMLARHLKGQRTVMLYVPSELMVYAAFDYNEFGVGKSVLEDGKILGAIRASIMLSNTLATINNAVGGKTIEIELDPEDEDPASTVEFMLSEHAKVNSQGFSRLLGSTHPLGLADQIQNHGVNVVVEGNSRYPATKFNVASREGTARPIDSEFEETMRRRHIQMFGLSPEVMEGINQSDFATTVVQNNLMLLKRVIQNQEKFEPFLTDFVRRYMLNSGIFLEEMRKLIKENISSLPDYIKDDKSLMDDDDKVDAFLYDFINGMTVTLPSPEVGDIKKAMESFESYSQALDTVIDAYINEEMFATDYSLGMEEMIPNIKAVTKAEFQRRWLRKYNVMPELDIFNTMEEEEGGPAFDLLEAASDHLNGINGSIQGYVKQLLKAAKKRAKTLTKIAEDKAALEQAKSDATSGGDDFGGGEGGLDDDLGGEGADDLSLDGEGGGEAADDLNLNGEGEGGEGLDGLDEGGEGEDLSLDESTDGAEVEGADEANEMEALNLSADEGGEEGSEELSLDEPEAGAESEGTDELNLDESTDETNEGLDIPDGEEELESGEASADDATTDADDLALDDTSATDAEPVVDQDIDTTDAEPVVEEAEPQVDAEPQSTEEPAAEEVEETPVVDKDSVELEDIAAEAEENPEVVPSTRASRSELIERALRTPVDETIEGEQEAGEAELEEGSEPTTDGEAAPESDAGYETEEEGEDLDPDLETIPEAPVEGAEEEGEGTGEEVDNTGEEEEEEDDDLNLPTPPKV